MDVLESLSEGCGQVGVGETTVRVGTGSYDSLRFESGLL